MSQQELEQEYQRLWIENQQLKTALEFRNALLEERAKAIKALVRTEAERLMNLAGLRK